MTLDMTLNTTEETMNDQPTLLTQRPCLSTVEFERPLERAEHLNDRGREHRTSRHQVATHSKVGSIDVTTLPAAVNDHHLQIPLERRPALIRTERTRIQRPLASFARLSSLDSLLKHHEEKAASRNSSSALQHLQNISTITDSPSRRDSKISDGLHSLETSDLEHERRKTLSALEKVEQPTDERSKFRNLASEIGFCSTIAMTQFLMEYLISGFAIELSKLVKGSVDNSTASQTTGFFWPASLLPLILSATLLIFARLSDMYGGYPLFMFGVVWLTIWTLIPGFDHSVDILDVSRAMQGLAIAAFMPSTFAMVGSIYSEGPRKNFVMGLYSGCAPLGFFGGLLVAAALPKQKAQWYFWIASALSMLTSVMAYITIPIDRTERGKLNLKMDWIGTFLITTGLILLSYALSVEPFAGPAGSDRSGFSLPIVIAPFVSGLILLGIAFWYEGWCATCPLLPFDFFKPRGVKSLSFAGLCFYATYGVWLYNSALYFQSPAVASDRQGISGTELALWYLPTAVGGVILCIAGGLLMHVVPKMVLLLVSALAWIAAPLIFAVAPLPLNYWEYVVPSMLCATLGIDVTFTVSIVYVSSIQPQKYQGLTGAVCSIVVNLAMSFALSISEIVMRKVESAKNIPGTVLTSHATKADLRIIWGFRAAFLYGAASASLGAIVCVLFVRLSRSAVIQKLDDEERPSTETSDSRPVGDGDGGIQIHAAADLHMHENSTETEQDPETRRGE